MYVVSLLYNESEIRTDYIINNFHIPINQIEFKIDATDMNSAFEEAKRRLYRYINSIEEIEIKELRTGYLIFSFRNNEDGLGVVYQISSE